MVTYQRSADIIIEPTARLTICQNLNSAEPSSSSTSCSCLVSLEIVANVVKRLAKVSQQATLELVDKEEEKEEEEEEEASPPQRRLIVSIKTLERRARPLIANSPSCLT